MKEDKELVKDMNIGYGDIVVLYIDSLDENNNPTKAYDMIGKSHIIIEVIAFSDMIVGQILDEKGGKIIMTADEFISYNPRKVDKGSKDGKKRPDYTIVSDDNKPNEQFDCTGSYMHEFDPFPLEFIETNTDNMEKEVDDIDNIITDEMKEFEDYFNKMKGWKQSWFVDLTSMTGVIEQKEDELVKAKKDFWYFIEQERSGFIQDEEAINMLEAKVDTLEDIVYEMRKQYDKQQKCFNKWWTLTYIKMWWKNR